MPEQVTPVIGIIGGSGLYDIAGLDNKEWRRAGTPWGEPSDELLHGTLDGVRCVFLPRQGTAETQTRAPRDARRDLADGRLPQWAVGPLAWASPRRAARRLTSAAS